MAYLESCWDRKTPYQIGLIVALIVSVTCLVLLCVVYIVFLTAWNRSEECEKMCRVMISGFLSANAYKFNPYELLDKSVVDSRPSLKVQGIQYNFLYTPEPPVENFSFPSYSTTTTTTTTTTEPPDVQKKSLGIKKNVAIKKNLAIKKKPPRKGRAARLDSAGEESYPSVAALIENLYIDEKSERIIKCPVVILSSKWSLASRSCLENNHTVKTMSVRINSDYWSKGGTIVGVKKLVVFKKLVAIEFTDGITKFVPQKIWNYESQEFQLASSLVWKGGLDGQLEKRKKFNKLKAVTVELHQEYGFGSDNGDCLENGSPLFFEDKLIGFQTAVHCGSGNFTFFYVSEYGDWLKTLD